MRFRTSLVVVLLTLVLASVAIVGTSGYFNARLSAENLSDQALDQTAFRVEQQLDHILSVAAGQAGIYAEMFRAGQLDGENLKQLTATFWPAMQVWTNLSYLSWSRERDGAYCHVQRIGDELRVTHDPGTNKPRERPYYKQAKSAAAPCWTETYVFSDGLTGTRDMPGVTRAVPIYDDGGTLQGVLTADFDLDALSAYLATLPVGEGGIGVVIEQRRDGSRKVIGHRERALLTQPVDRENHGMGMALVSAETFPDARVRALLEHLPPADERPPNATTHLEFESEGERWLGRFKRYDGRNAPGLEWIIAVIQPRQEIMGQVDRGNQIALVIIAVSALVALLAALWISARLTRSLRALAAESRCIQSFDLAPRPPIRTRLLEVQRLVDAFDHMKTGLRGFQRYLPLKLVRLLHEQRQEPELGGEDREVTIYFSDIARFSALSEKTPPMEVARRLGVYLGALSDEIRDREGTVVQYVGDEIMGMWNAPLSVADHPLKACRAVLRCAEIGRTLSFADGEPFETRFGLHTTTVAVGHFGTPERLYYGAIGDGVNFCSRLEGLNKHYGTTILISADCRAAVGDAVVARPIDRVAVKGRAGAAQVFELLGMAGDVSKEEVRAAERYGTALEDYFAARFVEAERGFEEVLGIQPDDAPSQIMIARCQAYRAAPPPADWDGVHVMQVK